MYVGDHDAVSRAVLFAGGGITGDPIRLSAVNSSGTGGDPDTTTGYTVGVWHHACGVWASSTSRSVYIDGGSKGSNTDSILLSGFSRTNISTRWVSNARGAFFDGCIAEPAIWDVALTDDEVASLARGFSPDQIRPQSLVSYWPIIGRHSPEIDVFGGFNLTVSGATQAEHPRVFLPRKLVSVPAIPGAATYTASGALTVGAATAAGSATFTPGTKTATGSLTVAPTTIAGTAEFDAPVYTASGTLSSSASVVSGAAQFTPGTKTATGNLTVGASTIAGDATFSPGTKTAVGSTIAGAATITGSATFAPGTKTATGSLSIAPSFINGSSTFDPPIYTASGALSVSASVSSGTALFASAVYQASGALTVGPTVVSGVSTFVGNRRRRIIIAGGY